MIKTSFELLIGKTDFAGILFFQYSIIFEIEVLYLHLFTNCTFLPSSTVIVTIQHFAR